MPELMTIKEVAELFRVGERSVYKWFHSGKLPGVKVERFIRFERSAVDAFRAAGTPQKSV